MAKIPHNLPDNWRKLTTFELTPNGVDGDGEKQWIIKIGQPKNETDWLIINSFWDDFLKPNNQGEDDERSVATNAK